MILSKQRRFLHLYVYSLFQNWPEMKATQIVCWKTNTKLHSTPSVHFLLKGQTGLKHISKETSTENILHILYVFFYNSFSVFIYKQIYWVVFKSTSYWRPCGQTFQQLIINNFAVVTPQTMIFKLILMVSRIKGRCINVNIWVCYTKNNKLCLVGQNKVLLEA